MKFQNNLRVSAEVNIVIYCTLIILLYTLYRSRWVAEVVSLPRPEAPGLLRASPQEGKAEPSRLPGHTAEFIIDVGTATNLDLGSAQHPLRATLTLNYTDLVPGIYAHHGYVTCPNHHGKYWLYLMTKPVNCREAFQKVVNEAGSGVPWPPPEQMPANLTEAYTLNNNAVVHLQYFSEMQNGNPEPYNWDENALAEYKQLVTNRQPFGNYPQNSLAFLDALQDFSIKGQRGAIIGSMNPWVEAATFVYGAREIVTQEYHEIHSTYPNLIGRHPVEMAKEYLAGKLETFDFAISFSSLEHSGLGRYGDPLNPWGDTEQMALIACTVRPKGLLYLGVPMGHDAVAFNAGRVYGPIRLPLLTANWKILAVYHGLPLESLWQNDHNQHQHPTVVLQNMRDKPCE